MFFPNPVWIWWILGLAGFRVAGLYCSCTASDTGRQRVKQGEETVTITTQYLATCYFVSLFCLFAALLLLQSKKFPVEAIDKSDFSTNKKPSIQDAVALIE